MRIVRTRLLEMMPELSVFLDVEDLKDISDLEGYIERSETVLVMCTKGYFQSRNCIRELRCAVRLGKPLLAMLDLDSDTRSLSVEEVRAELLQMQTRLVAWGLDGDGGPSGTECFDALFAREPIEWNRIGVFQDITMRLSAERVLPEGHAPTCIAGEITQAPVQLPPPRRGCKYHLHVSPHNLKANEFALEVTDWLARRQPKAAPGLQHATQLDALEQCEAMLLYLNGLTWTSGWRTASLSEEIAHAMRLGIPILLAHEMPGVGGHEERHGVAFSTFFDSSATPIELIKANIYGTIAVPLKGGPWREGSMVQMVQAIAAVPERSDPQSIDAPVVHEPARVSRRSGNVRAVLRASKGRGSTFRLSGELGDDTHATFRPSEARSPRWAGAPFAGPSGSLEPHDSPPVDDSDLGDTAASDCGETPKLRNSLYADRTSTRQVNHRRSHLMDDEEVLHGHTRRMPWPTRLPPPVGWKPPTRDALTARKGGQTARGGCGPTARLGGQTARSGEQTARDRAVGDGPAKASMMPTGSLTARERLAIRKHAPLRPAIAAPGSAFTARERPPTSRTLASAKKECNVYTQSSRPMDSSVNSPVATVAPNSAAAVKSKEAVPPAGLVEAERNLDLLDRLEPFDLFGTFSEGGLDASELSTVETSTEPSPRQSEHTMDDDRVFLPLAPPSAHLIEEEPGCSSAAAALSEPRDRRRSDADRMRRIRI